MPACLEIDPLYTGAVRLKFNAKNFTLVLQQMSKKRQDSPSFSTYASIGWIYTVPDRF